MLDPLADRRPRPQLSVDQRQAMHTAATRMSRDYARTFSTETIEEFLYTSYDQLALQAVIANYLPLLAERFARQRLTALDRSRSRGRASRPVVLFVCTHNANRSQMALGFFTAMAADRAIAWSAGSHPRHTVDAATISTMAERGIDIAREFPKPWTEETVAAADVIVTMGCGDACPIVDGPQYRNWKIDDPSHATPDDVRRIRDSIEHHVRNLLTEMGIDVRDQQLATTGDSR